MVRYIDPPAMTIAVDLGHKATKQTNKNKTHVKASKTGSSTLFSIFE